MKNDVRLFEQQKVRTHWDEKAEKWYFSIVDVISILTDQPHHQGARNYWKVLKSRLLKEGNETVTNCNRLKLVAEDGKLRLTDAADTEQLLRLIQSIPSPKAEPFKQWLAKTGYERMKEIADPEQSLDRARENWQKLGRSAVNTREKRKGEVRRAGASHFSLPLLPFPSSQSPYETHSFSVINSRIRPMAGNRR
ncbi:MAG: Bro-N domain-containing protein [Sphingobacteriales bacterium]|jgi:DNA-damage-inducible protein D